jgi:uncharacterized membrane protein
MTSQWARIAPRLQLVVVAVVMVAAAVAWWTGPARVPVHWNVSGQVDRWGGRAEGLLLLPLLLMAMAVLQRVLPRLDPGRANYPNFAGAWAGVWLGITVFLAGLYVAVLLEMNGRPVDMSVVGPALMGGLFVLIGAFMGKLRPNWFMGVRTPWTLSSKTSWIRTHRLAGWMFVASGLIVWVTALLWRGAAPYALAGCALVTGVASTAYSYFVWRDATDRIPPAGSSPE